MRVLLFLSACLACSFIRLHSLSFVPVPVFLLLLEMFKISRSENKYTPLTIRSINSYNKQNRSISNSLLKILFSLRSTVLLACLNALNSNPPVSRFFDVKLTLVKITSSLSFFAHSNHSRKKTQNCAY